MGNPVDLYEDECMDVTLVIGKTLAGAIEIAEFKLSEEEQSYFDYVWSSDDLPEDIGDDFCEVSTILWEAMKRGLQEIHDNGWEVKGEGYGRQSF